MTSRIWRGASADRIEIDGKLVYDKQWESTMPKVKLKLVGLNGNAFVVLQQFRKAAKKQGWTGEQIAEVVNEAMAGDYDHLLGVIIANTTEGTNDY